MAFCTNCGKQLPDGAAFCTNCGTAQANRTAQTPNANPNPNPNPNPAPNPGYGNPNGFYVSGATIPPYGAATEGASKLRGFIARNSALLLVVICGLAVNILLSFVSNLSNDADFFTSFVSAVVAALIPIALLLVYLQGQKSGPFPTAGFTIVQVISIIECVFMFLAAALCLILGVAFEELANDLDDLLEGIFEEPAFADFFEMLGELFDVTSYDDLIHLFAIFFFVVGIVMALVGVFFIFVARNSSKLKKLVTLNVPARLSGVLMVALWIFGVCGAINAVMSFDDDVMAGISGLVSAAVYIISALLAGKAKKEL